MRDIGDEAITLVIRGGRILTPDGLIEGDLALAGDRIAGVIDGPPPPGAALIDAGGRLVAPGIVDIHGDAFERQVMPRPKTAFPVDIALMETDRQLLANGVTTAFHAVTVSWEPGLRGAENAAALIGAILRLRPRLGCDTRVHIRWETFALEAVAQVEHWLAMDPPPILAFNDHTTNGMRDGHIARKFTSIAERCGMTVEAYLDLQAGIWMRRNQVPAAVDRLAAAARSAGVVLLAHDETSPEERVRNRALGVVASEFPLDRDTAAAARAAGEHAILGAPNVLRGGSHNGMMDATSAVAAGLCTVLTSDYYYPAPLLAVFRLVSDGILALPDAWALVSANAAAAAGLQDRGRIAPGRRADLLVIDDAAPRVASTIVAGREALRAA